MGQFCPDINTERKIRAIQSDQGGIRSKLATTIDMKAWQAGAPSKHTFAAERIGELVEEFKGTNLDFSSWKVKLAVSSAQALVTGMKAVAPAKQIAVVMHDNIALVQDLGGLFQQSRQAMESYTAAPDRTSMTGDVQRYRKMLIAELIGRIYESAYAEKAGLAGKGSEAFERALRRDIDEREWKRRRFADNLAVMEREPAKHRPSSYPDARRQLDAMPTDPIGQRAAALSESAPLYARHVREADRVKFMQDFAKETDKRHSAVLDRKNDRCRWLESYQSVAASDDMGTAFLRYDTEDSNSSTSHALAFASCIESMIWGTETVPSGKKDNERELFERWWKLPWGTNPILLNIDYDKGFADALWENKKDVGTDTVMSKGLGQLMRYVALHFLMEQVSVYTLSRFPRPGTQSRPWHGAARDAVANRVHQLAEMGTVEDANRLVQMLETRYQDRLSTRSFRPQEAAEALDVAAGFPRGTVAVGSLAMGGTDTMDLIVYQRLTPVTRLANPFLQVFERGVAGGVAFLSLLNLKAAALAYDPTKNGATVLNLAAAIMGIGSAMNGVLLSTRALVPQIYLRASILSTVLQRLASVAALRRFGYGGAIFDAFSNWFKAADQKKIGNHEAAKAFAVAGLGLGLGGAALTTAGGAVATGTTMAGVVAGVPVWGWLAAGAILVGVGVWWLVKGDDAQFSSLGFWLNDGSFGKREQLGRKKEVIVTYASLDDENKGYVQASYAPQRVEADWHMTSNTLTLKIAYPLTGTIQDVKGLEVGNSDTQVRALPGEERLPSGGSIRTYRIFGLNKRSGFRYSLRSSYVPTVLDEQLLANFTFSNEDTPWYY
ncbi:hypothetical protein CVS37_40895 [Burkholderia lata]|uniref:hypothetical protein n=1 Tax=Burkholderia lata (strain ATCC 17760 / DSM 23089 / LMG 22485 / NCIMB 9086 / R18194 / 383) TaxID=482957 RepID=UPI000F091606|nr:hypothetical protein [Burkholderia lata]AYQ44266.1 hypothetical protein CVS37_40895 [Burkholderia lata]